MDTVSIINNIFENRLLSFYDILLGSFSITKLTIDGNTFNETNSGESNGAKYELIWLI